MSSIQFQPYIAAGANFSQTLMLVPTLDEDLMAYAAQFRLPMIFIVGSEDLVTPQAEPISTASLRPRKISLSSQVQDTSLFLGSVTKCCENLLPMSVR